MGIQSDIFAKKLTRKMNTIIEIILAFPMIARPLSSREDYIKNKIIKITVIGKPYHIPINRICLLFTSSFSISITFAPPKNQINLQSLHQILLKYYTPAS